MMDLRLAMPNDVPLLLPLIADYWVFEAIAGFEPQRVTAQLTHLLSAPGLGAVWIAVADGAAAGYLIAVYVFSLEHLGITAEIDEFYVVPSMRSHGVGAKLLELAEAGLVRAGCTSVSLQLSKRNETARAFYRKHGYTERAAYEILEKKMRPG